MMITCNQKPLIVLWMSMICLPSYAWSATVEGHPGESPPGNTVSPNPATPLDTVRFTLNADSITHGNSCAQESALGKLGLDVNQGDRVAEVVKIGPGPRACFLIYSPVTGVQGEIDSLFPGRWTIADDFNNVMMFDVVREGDANKDGIFDSADLVQVFKAAEYEDDIENNSTWEEGDWTGDLDFTTGDLVAAFQRSVGQAAVIQVPEPNTSSACLLTVLLLAWRKRRNTAQTRTS